MRASREFGGRGVLQCSQVGRSSSTVCPHRSLGPRADTSGNARLSCTRADSLPPVVNRTLTFQRSANARQVVIAVADGVVLQHELARDRRIRIERRLSGAIELFVRERADRRGGGAVAPQQISSLADRPHMTRAYPLVRATCSCVRRQVPV